MLFNSLVERIGRMADYNKELEDAGEIYLYIDDNSIDRLDEVLSEIDNCFCFTIPLTALQIGQFCVSGESANLIELLTSLDSLGIIFDWELT